MEIKVVNAGDCMICGKQIQLVVPRGYNKLPNIFFCPECEKRIVKKDMMKKRRVKK